MSASNDLCLTCGHVIPKKVLATNYSKGMLTQKNGLTKFRPRLLYVDITYTPSTPLEGKGHQSKKGHTAVCTLMVKSKAGWNIKSARDGRGISIRILERTLKMNKTNIYIENGNGHRTYIYALLYMYDVWVWIEKQEEKVWRETESTENWVELGE